MYVCQNPWNTEKVKGGIQQDDREIQGLRMGP